LPVPSRQLGFVRKVSGEIKRFASRKEIPVSKSEHHSRPGKVVGFGDTLYFSPNRSFVQRRQEYIGLQLPFSVLSPGRVFFIKTDIYIPVTPYGGQTATGSS